MTGQMSDADSSKPARGRAPLAQRLLGWLGATIVRAIGLTLRFHFEDRAGIFQAPLREPFIWSFWHNRVVTIPILRVRFFQQRPNGATMTSQSKDGEWAAELVLRFGIAPIRGSTSRGGSAAVREMTRFLRRGEDVGVTPDGPRGPRYHFKAGLVFVAQLSGRPIMPVGVEYSRCLRFKSWDGFMIPLPFSRVDVTFGDPVHVTRTHSDDEFEAERRRCEEAMMTLVRRH
jgi:Kdo2-lipid IVA 3' secondary acyltransferase